MIKYRLTESELKNIVFETALRLIREYIGDNQEFGRYDIDDGIEQDYMSDDEYNSLQNFLGDENEQYDNDLKQMGDDWEAEQYIGDDYYDPYYDIRS